jgi:di/tricarboxylate transporter
MLVLDSAIAIVRLLQRPRGKFFNTLLSQVGALGANFWIEMTKLVFDTNVISSHLYLKQPQPQM